MATSSICAVLHRSRGERRPMRSPTSIGRGSHRLPAYRRVASSANVTNSFQATSLIDSSSETKAAASLVSQASKPLRRRREAW
jgi:hypothetical protein